MLKTKSTTEIDRIIGARVRQLRMQLDMSQEAFGIEVGVTFQQIQKYEKGATTISCARMLQFAEILQTTPSEILGSLDRGPKAVAANPHSAAIFKAANEFATFPSELQVLIRQLCAVVGKSLNNKKKF